jgi:hypothetical protein
MHKREYIKAVFRSFDLALTEPSRSDSLQDQRDQALGALVAAMLADHQSDLDGRADDWYSQLRAPLSAIVSVFVVPPESPTFYAGTRSPYIEIDWS